MCCLLLHNRTYFLKASKNPLMRALLLLLLLLGVSSFTSSFTLTGTIASVWEYPTNLPTPTPCDPTLNFDLGCNSFWLREDGWGTYLQQQATMWPLLRSNLGSHPQSTVLLYFPLFLADPLHAGLALERLDQALSDARSAELATALFIGRPDYHGNGTSGSWNPVLDATARSYVLDQLAALLTPARASGLSFVSLYWMGLACHGAGQGVCSEAAVKDYLLATTDAMRKASKSRGGGLPLPVLNHVDGMFFDACWPQPCALSSWSYGGYSPTSLNNTADGLLGESWAMGSLVGAVQDLYTLGITTSATTLLLDDTPNCDLQPTKPCSTGSLAGDIAVWGADLPKMGLMGTWGVWAAVDGGTEEGVSPPNYYGDLLGNGTGLTAKGRLHKQRALQSIPSASSSASTIQFASYTWFVKEGKSGPGPNTFLASNVNVDPTTGALQLRITQDPSSKAWGCSEVFLDHSLGYGTYHFTMTSPVTGFDKSVVLGLFTYENDSREIDIEFSAWSDQFKGMNADYAVQPSAVHRFAQPSGGVTHASYTWGQGFVNFTCGGNTTWSHVGKDVPPPGGERVHLNLWLVRGNSPTQGALVAISNFSFTHL